ncbi:MAG: hypothetical protein ACO3ND_10470 [Opitutales bacterium]
MKFAWIGGWGVSPEELRPLAAAHAPDAEHVLAVPVVGAAELAAGCDALIAWSLGAHLVLEAAARGVRMPPRVLLIAPFTSFCREHGTCGKVSETQVRYLRRWMESDPGAALADFRQRAGLPASPAAGWPYPQEELLAGLEVLAQPAGVSLISFARGGLPAGWEAYVGEKDTLLDASGVCESVLGCHIVQDAGHALRDFLSPES